MTDDDAHVALLGDQLDRSFGAGPEGLPTPADRLAVGRRALRRRRRLTLAGISVAVVAAVGLGTALAGTTGEHGADGPPPPIATKGTKTSPTAAPPSPSPSPNDTAEALARKSRRAERNAQRSMTDSVPATYDALGNVVVKDGWRVVQRIDDPLGLHPPEDSSGLVVTDGQQTRWVLLSRERAVDQEGHPLPGAFGVSGSSDPPGKGYARFEDWLASMVAIQGGPQTHPLLTVDDTDRLQAGPRAEIVAVRPAPAIEGYTTEGDRMAEVTRDGRTWFVVVRGHGRDTEVIPVDADVLAAPTFAAFLDHVRKQVTSGAGLR
jgi:hypothetical protein